MTFEEAIRHAEAMAKNKKYWVESGCCCDDTEMEDEYIKCAEEHRQLAEWLKDYSRLLEKATPKRYDIDIDTAICPVCRAQLERQSMLGENILFHEQYNYCPECGQKIDWSPTTKEHTKTEEETE